MWTWIIGSIIIGSVDVIQAVQLRKEKINAKEWIVWVVLNVFVFSGIVICALELDSPIPNIIAWVTPFTDGIYRLLG